MAAPYNIKREPMPAGMEVTEAQSYTNMLRASKFPQNYRYDAAKDRIWDVRDAPAAPATSAAAAKFPVRQKPQYIDPVTKEILPTRPALAPGVVPDTWSPLLSRPADEVPAPLTSTIPEALRPNDEIPGDNMTPEDEIPAPPPEGPSAWSGVKDYVSTSVSVAAHRRKEAFEEKKHQLEKDRMRQTAGTGHVFRGGTPTAARMPSPSPYNDMPSDVTSPRSDYSGRARMVVLPMGNDPSSVGPQASFDDFFITNIQGADSEKTDVIETFGAPHLFASGRFMRKYQISGQCRVNPLNVNSESRPEYRTSQYALFQRFYDLYLRATMQAQRSTYTRLIVDDEYLDGWIVSLSPSRAADSEQFAHFTFTMLVRNRGSVYDEAADKVLAPFAAVKGKPKDAKTKAKLELADVNSKGELVLTGSPFSITLSPDMATFDITGLKLLAKTPQNGLASVDLKLDGGAGLELSPSRMTLRVGAAEDLKLTVRVKDFRALQQAAADAVEAQDAPADGKFRDASSSITLAVIATSQNSVQQSLNLLLKRLDATKLATLSATLMGKTVDWAASTSASKPLRLRIAAPITNPSLDLKLSAQFMTGNGATLAADLVTATTLAGPVIQSKRAVNLPKEGGTAADGPAEDQAVVGQVAITTNSTEATVEGTAAVWTLQLNLGDAAKTLVTTPPESPFKLSSAYLIRIPTSFTMPGLPTTRVDGPIVEVVVDVPPGKTRNWLARMNPPQISGDRTDSKDLRSTAIGRALPLGNSTLSSVTIELQMVLTEEGRQVVTNANAIEYLKGASWQVRGHFTQPAKYTALRGARRVDFAADGSIGSSNGGSLTVFDTAVPLTPARIEVIGSVIYATFVAVATSQEGKEDILFESGFSAYGSHDNRPVADSASLTPADPTLLAPPTPYKRPDDQP